MARATLRNVVEQLGKKYPWTRDAATFELASTTHGLPKGISFNASTNHLSCETTYFVWSERAVDVWLEVMRLRKSQIVIRLGRRWSRMDLLRAEKNVEGLEDQSERATVSRGSDDRGVAAHCGVKAR